MTAAAAGCCLFDTAVGRLGIAWIADGRVQAVQLPQAEVTTYGEMARGLGEPGAARAVGQALGHNPFAPLVPCHRILAAALDRFE